MGLSGENVVDIGCGTAVLAMASGAQSGPTMSLASDIDEVAVEVAAGKREAANGLGGPREMCRGGRDLIIS